MLTPPKSPLKTGDEGPDVKVLYEYLRQLGYAVHAPRRADEALAESVRYDEELAESVGRYQQFFGLDVDGELGETTLERMRQPRCGVPDLSPGRSVLPTAVPTTRAWPRTQLTYDIIRFTRDLTGVQITQAIVQAFKTWSAVTPLRFRPLRNRQPQVLLALMELSFMPPGFTRIHARAVRRLAEVHRANMLIGFLFGEDHGDPPTIGGMPFDPGPIVSVVGHARFPPVGAEDPFDGDIHFNDAATWRLDPEPGSRAHDLVAVAIHEIGHALGLDHPQTGTEPDSVMVANYVRGRRQLSTADVEAIQSLYGPPP